MSHCIVAYNLPLDCKRNTALQAHSLRTEIVPLELDILKHWDKIVEVSKECTVIFNMVDIGNYFDHACQSLALNRKIPMVIGGTVVLAHTAYNLFPRYISCYVDH